jgi:hypothetical protein
VGARLQKGGVGRVGRWPGDVRRGRVHGGACGWEVRGKGGADKRGPRGERATTLPGRARGAESRGAREKGVASTDRPHRSEGERRQARGRAKLCQLG